METKDKFAVFILSHGRPDRVVTYSTLRKQGYTGDIYIVIDNEDETADEYIERYGDEVIVFDKAEAEKLSDPGDNFKNRKVILHARNASFGIAEKLGIKYFLQLDDDYDLFLYKFTKSLEYKERKAMSLDKLFMAYLNYFKKINAVTLTMAQNGDFIGGRYSGNAQKIGLKRKAMNTFFCSTDRPLRFIGRLNEDVNTYTSLGHKGVLFLTVVNTSIRQKNTQKNKGGMSEVYLDEGTYIKSFYPIMYCPSFVKIAPMGDKHRRIHHCVHWNHAVPCIIDEGYRKTVKQD